jgi:hypothetical protein
LKNAVRIDELFFHNYFLDKTSNETVFRDYGHRLVIAPRKSFLIEGDKFEGDIYLTTYLMDNVNEGLTFMVNDKNLPIKDGIVHYSSMDNTIGLKLLKMKVLIRNPATGERTTVTGEFEYHVLPKCSQNCQ